MPIRLIISLIICSFFLAFFAAFILCFFIAKFTSRPSGPRKEDEEAEFDLAGIKYECAAKNINVHSSAATRMEIPRDKNTY